MSKSKNISSIPPGVRLASEVPPKECNDCPWTSEDHTMDFKFPYPVSPQSSPASDPDGLYQGFEKVCVKDYRRVTGDAVIATVTYGDETAEMGTPAAEALIGKMVKNIIPNKKGEEDMPDKTKPIILRTETSNLACKLTDTEFNERADELATTVQAITSEESRQDSVKAELKARLTELESKQRRLAQVVSRKEEYRDIKVVIELHPNDIVKEIRQDTGEIIRTRSARPEEVQRQMPV